MTTDHNRGFSKEKSTFESVFIVLLDLRVRYCPHPRMQSLRLCWASHQMRVRLGTETGTLDHTVGPAVQFELRFFQTSGFALVTTELSHPPDESIQMISIWNNALNKWDCGVATVALVVLQQVTGDDFILRRKDTNVLYKRLFTINCSKVTI